MKRSTLTDISKQTGYSISTISRALNGKSKDYRISQEAVEKIIKVAEDLKFKSDFRAQNLCKHNTHTIGLLVPHIENPFFAEIAKTMIHEAQKSGYIIIVIDTMDKAEIEKRALESLLVRNVDGIIIVPTTNDPLFLEEVSLKIPIVLADRYFEQTPLPYISTDNYQGAYTATNLLLNAKHHRILCIQGNRNSITNKERIHGFMDAMHISGYDSEAMIRGNDFSARNGYIETKLALKDIRPTAIFTLSSTILLGTLKALNEYKLNIPKDISVVSFDNNSYMDYLSPSITSIAQPVEQMGIRAFDMIIKMISGKKIIHPNILLRPSIVKRDSIRTI